MALTPEEFFKRLQQKIPELKKEILSDVIVVEAEKQWAENFEKEGFVDRGLKKWPKRKKDDPGRKLLVKSSTLKGHATSGRVVGDKVVFDFPLEYERVHNEGLKAGRGEGFQMPKRQYIGESAKLEKAIEKKAKKLLDQKFNNI